MKKKFVKPVVKKMEIEPCLLLSSSGTTQTESIEKGTGSRPNTAQARRAFDIITDY